MIKTKNNSERYAWGKDCLGWRLLDTQELSIIEEEMPPGTEEVFHYHKKSNQFFYVLEGTASFLVDKQEFDVKRNEGLYIESGKVHKIMNKSAHTIRFLVISNPSVRNDRKEV